MRASLVCPRQLAFAFALAALAPGSAGARPTMARRTAARPAQVRARAPVAPVAPALEVEEMGARAAAATDALRARMRERVAHHLRALIDGHLLTAPQGYVVDGSIDTLTIVERPDGLEVSCAVRLILSARRSGAMLLMTTGQASLSSPRHAAGSAADGRFELEVLDGAVRAASDELVQHFEARRKT
jgi:hypothetical protein